MFCFWYSKGSSNTLNGLNTFHFIRRRKKFRKWIWSFRNSWRASFIGPRNPGMDMVSWAKDEDSAKDITGMDPSTWLLVSLPSHLSTWLPSASLLSHNLSTGASCFRDKEKEVPTGPGGCMLQRNQQEVLGHQLRFHGAKPLLELCARERVREH